MVLHTARAQLPRRQCATVCYMAETNERARVGIRELRQNLSIYIDRVKEGETLEVTEHGHPVGRADANSTPIKVALRANGRRRPHHACNEATDWLLLPIELPPGAEPVSDILIRMRDEERY